MRKLALALAFAALILGLVWLATRGPDATHATAGPAARTHAAETSTSATPEPVNTTPAAPAQDDARAVVDAVERAAVEQKLNDCVVLGRVVDELGQPISGLVVRLSAFKSWSPRAKPPRLSGPYEFVGFEVATDSAGAFRFEVPTPTNDLVQLSMEADVYRDVLYAHFSTQATQGRAPLVAGDNDLGLFELKSTGAIEGFVRDTNGAPIELAAVTLTNLPDPTLQRRALTDATGRYVMGHVMPGEFGLSCQALDRLGQVKNPVKVEARRTTYGVDFSLAEAPLLRGVVVEESGAPISGASLVGWPSTSGTLANAMTEMDGAFTVSLPQDQPYSLECKRDGFEPFGVGERNRTYAPGTKDIRIVLRTAARTRFRVVDARDGAPLERFGIAITRERFTQPPLGGLNTFSRGEVELAATAGLDQVVVHAPGFQVTFGPVKHDTPTEAVQTVRLKPANSVRGRVIRDGEPVAGARVVFEPGLPELRIVDGAPKFVEGSFQTFEHKRKSARCDSEGRFVFEGVEDGMCRVAAEDVRGAVSVSPAVELSNGTEHNFGDLNLSSGGIVVGRVLLPPRCVLGGLEIQLDGPSFGRSTRTDETGAFRFEGVHPGEHHVQASARTGQHMASERVRFEVAEGATQELELDLSDLGVGQVSITVTLNGQPLPNAEVTIVPLSKAATESRLGKTDASGRVVGWARANGPSVVQVLSADQFSLCDPARVLDLAHDSKLDERLEFVVTALTVRLPTGVDWPAEGAAVLSFLGPDERSLGGARIHFREGLLVTAGATLDASNRSVVVEFAPLRAVALQFSLMGSTQSEPSESDPNVNVQRPTMLLQTRVPLELRANAANEVLLH
ncbi:MAG: carboxypeptidase regulatory-like domain-containing protein [Planctomycetes bacterium]|nr:carboxypeptidase regulatory-like domain-containing protein [Planctomycetota bacterium]